MRQEEKIELSLLLERLQNKQNYRNPEFAFEVLLYGWCKKKGHSTNWLSDVRRRGWLSLPMAMAVMKVGAAGIETISGAMKRPKKQNGHNHGNYLVATHRKAASENPNCQRVYSFDADRYARSTDPTSNELLARARFSAVGAAVRARQKDLMQINQDNTAFLAQRDTAGGKKTMKSYLWKVCGEQYDAEHGA